MTQTHPAQKVISVCEKFDLPITLADPDQHDMPLVFVSKRFLKLTGYQTTGVLGRNCRFLQGPHTDRDSVRRVSAACGRRAKHTGCLLNYRKDGSRFHNLLIIEPIFLSQTKTLIMGCQFEFEATTTAKQVRYQVEYANVVLRSVYRSTQTDQRLLANAEVLRARQLKARSDNAFSLIKTYLAHHKSLDAICRSQAVLEATRGVSMNTLHRFA